MTIRSRQEERQILDTMATTAPNLAVQPVVIDPEQIMRRATVVDHDLHRRQGARLHRRYRLAPRATRRPTGSISRASIQYGASPRATIALTLAARRLRLPQRPRLRHAAGREGSRARTSCSIASPLTYEAEAENLTSRAHRPEDSRYAARALGISILEIAFSLRLRMDPAKSR